MDHFCLIFPDAVYNGTALRIVEKLTRHGVEIIDKSIRPLTLEEAKVIFYPRRFDSNFIEFCRILTMSNVWLLKVRSNKLLKIIEQHIPEEIVGDIFIPADEEDNLNFLTLIAESKDSKQQLKTIIKNIKQRVGVAEWQADLQFSAEAIAIAHKTYSLFVAMQIAGFSEAQAFDIVLNATPTLSERLRPNQDDFLDEDDIEDEDDDD